MKSYVLLLLVLAILITPCAFGQSYTARLVDAETQKPVAFANIGIPEGETGTNSDETGRFTLEIPPALSDKTLAVSLIGYEDLKMPVGEFLRKAAANEPLALRRGAKQLGEVLVRPAKMVAVQLGNNYRCGEGGGSAPIPFPYVREETRKRNGTIKREADTLTEVGTLMRVKAKTVFLDSLAIGVGACSYPEVFYRVNLYEMADDVPRNILKEPLYVRRTAGELRGGVIKVALTDRNLVVHNNFIVSIERVKDLGPGSMELCASFGGAPTFMRVASHQEALRKLPLVSFGISAYVTYRKD